MAIVKPVGLFVGYIFTCYGSSSSIVWLYIVDQLEYLWVKFSYNYCVLCM